MEDFQPPQWSEFKVPGGGADLSYVGPVAGAYASAADMAVRPLSRMLEQAFAQKMQERMASREMDFRAQQAERQYQEQALLQTMQDHAALQRVEAQLRGDIQRDTLKYGREDASATALRDVMAPIMQGAGGGGGQSAQGVQPGTGPLSLESMAQLPAAQQQDEFPALVIDDKTAKALGTQGVEFAARTWGTERERAQSNREQRVKAEKAAQEAAQSEQAVGAWRRGLLSDASLSDADKLRIALRAETGDLKGATEEYEAVSTSRRTETAKAREEERTGRFSSTLGGVASEYPASIREPKSEGAKRQFFSQMSGDEKAAVQLAATAMVARSLPGRSELTVQDAAGLMQDTQFQGMYAQQLAKASQQIAQQFGWKADPKQAAAPVAAPAAPPTPEDELPKRLLALAPDSMGSSETQALIRDARMKLGLFNKNTAAELREFFSRSAADREVFLKTGQYPEKPGTEEQKNAAKRAWIQSVERGQERR